ncbi:hypothetical protein PG993_006259 [Apiospora rasikravindrae]|uniref:Rhodopsin domain-containing protein n=1 Tax=Apiospora rasikravindrae TaxID=990691 RepID=A0ABR1T6U0_9PEZI
MDPIMDPNAPMLITEHAIRGEHIFLGVTIPLIVLSGVTFGVRMARYRTRTSIWAEVCITLGFALTLADWGLLVATLQHTPGLKSHDAFINSTKYGFFAIPIWGLSMAFIKSSIGLTLLQIKKDLWFRLYIWFNIVLMNLYGFGNLLFILLQCRPLPAAWGDFERAGPDFKCAPPMAITIASTLGAVASILTDVLLSLAPLSFLWSLKRPKRERVVLGLLMSLGLFAGACSLLKNLEVRSLADAATLPPPQLFEVDFGAKAIYINIWTALEQLLGVVAACTPFCKPLFERYLGAVLDGLHVPLSFVKSSYRGTRTTTSSFGDRSTAGYGRASSASAAKDKYGRNFKISSPLGSKADEEMGEVAGGSRGGGGAASPSSRKDSEEVPLAIEMVSRLGSSASKRQGGVVRRTDIIIDSGSMHSDDVDRLESLQWKLVRI